MNFPRFARRTLFSLIAAAAAAPALATSVTVNANWNGGYGTANLVLDGHAHNQAPEIPLTLSYNNQSFEAFCMEVEQDVRTGTTVNYSIGSFANDKIARLFAVAGFNGANPGSDAVDTLDEKTALQLAIWESVYDGLTGSFTSGRFTVSNVSSANALNLANGYLAAAAALSPGQVSASMLTRYSNAQYQDLVSSSGAMTISPLSAVPEPETALMWLAGVGALVGAGRRRQRSASAA